MEDIVIIGFGGHAKSIADCIEKASLYNIVGYTDLQDRHIDMKYYGDDASLATIYRYGVHNAVLGMGYIGNSFLRDSIVQKAKEIGFTFPVIIDPSASIAKDIVIKEGCFVGKRAVINAGTIVEEFSIINSGAIVEHDNVIEKYSHVSVGAILCGNVHIGHHSFIGAGTIVIQGISVEENVILGAGSVVNRNIQKDATAVGVPAKIIREKGLITNE